MTTTCQFNSTPTLLASEMSPDEPLTAITLYRIGQCLSVMYSTRNGVDLSAQLVNAFDNLLSNTNDIEEVMGEFNEALKAVVNGPGSFTIDEKEGAILASCAIYASSPCACQNSTMEDVADVIEIIATNYKNSEVEAEGFPVQNIFLAAVARLFVSGLFQSHADVDADNLLGTVLDLLQRLLSLNDNTCIGDAVDLSLKSNEIFFVPTPGIFEAAREAFLADDTQLEYVKEVLNAFPRSEEQNLKNSSLTPLHDVISTVKEPNAKDVSAGLPSMIAQIRDVFPELGEGYVEAALACYRGNVSNTISALLEGGNSLHPQLRHIDTKLGARKKESADLYVNDDKEAIDIQKNHIRQMQREEENRAFLLSSALDYNDDYDDQFDGIGDSGGAGGMIGNTDSAMLDIDYDAIRTYNQAFLDLEREDAFWNEMRNTNRSVKPSAAGSDESRLNEKKKTKQHSQSHQKKGNAENKRQNPNDKGNARNKDFSKSDKRRSENRKRAQQKHNKARALRKTQI